MFDNVLVATMKIHNQLTAAELSKGSSDGQILFIKKQKKVPVLRWVITILLIAFYSIFFVLFHKQHSLVLNLLAALANGSYDFSGYGGYEYFRFGVTFTFWGFVVAGLILLGRFSFLRASRGIFSFDKLYQDKSPLFSQTQWNFAITVFITRQKLSKVCTSTNIFAAWKKQRIGFSFF